MPAWEPGGPRLCLWRTFRKDESRGQDCVMSVVRRIDRSKKRTRWVGRTAAEEGPIEEGCICSTALNAAGNSSEKVNKEGSLYLPTRRLLVILIKQVVDKKFRKEKEMARG